jgi:hypothetical protein
MTSAVSFEQKLYLGDEIRLEHLSPTAVTDAWPACQVSVFYAIFVLDLKLIRWEPEPVPEITT